jgi:hypothetical protein
MQNLKPFENKQLVAMTMLPDMCWVVRDDSLLGGARREVNRVYSYTQEPSTNAGNM